jgi:hypothetical protein
MLANRQLRSISHHLCAEGSSNCPNYRELRFSQAAVSGDKAKDKSQGELTGILKTMGYTADQVFKF